MQYARLLVLVGLSASLAGCASMSKSECEVGDWYAVGKTDGYNGRPTVTRIAAHNEACNPHGISVDQVLYNQGHAEGLPSYCTLARGVSEGKAGHAYSGVCQGQADADFRQGHSVGMEYFNLQSEINSLRGKANYARSEKKKFKPGSPEYYQKDGDIRVYETQIQGLIRDQGLINMRIDNLLTTTPQYPYSPMQVR